MAQFNAVKRWGPFPSSDGKRDYFVQRNDTNIMSCNCKGWTVYKNRPRDCRHVQEVAKKEGLKLVAIEKYFFVDDGKLSAALKKWGGNSPAEIKLLGMINDYNAMLKQMAKLDPLEMFAMAADVQVLRFKIDAYIENLDNINPETLAKLNVVSH